MDVISLASIYTIRIIAGAALLNVAVSFWLLTFSRFIFLVWRLLKGAVDYMSCKIQICLICQGETIL